MPGDSWGQGGEVGRPHPDCRGSDEGRSSALEESKREKATRADGTCVHRQWGQAKEQLEAEGMERNRIHRGRERTPQARPLAQEEKETRMGVEWQGTLWWE